VSLWGIRAKFGLFGDSWGNREVVVVIDIIGVVMFWELRKERNVREASEGNSVIMTA